MTPEPIELTVRAVHQLFQGLAIIAKRPGVSKFTLAAMLNRRTIQNVVDAVDEMTTNIPANVQAYYVEQERLVKELAQRDDQKNLVMAGPNSYRVPQTEDNLAKLKDVDSRHAEAVEWIGEHKQSMETMLNTSMTVRLVRVGFADLPDGVSTLVIEQLSPMIDLSAFDVKPAELPEALKKPIAKKPE